MARTELSGKVLTYHAQDPGFNSQQWKKEKTPRSGTWHIPINLALERLRQGDHEFKPSLHVSKKKEQKIPKTPLDHHVTQFPKSEKICI
jgi:hypothetical protein